MFRRRRRRDFRVKDSCSKLITLSNSLNIPSTEGKFQKKEKICPSENVVVGKFGVRKFVSENLVSENLFRTIWCQKICFGKFGVGKIVVGKISVYPCFHVNVSHF